MKKAIFAIIVITGLIFSELMAQVSILSETSVTINNQFQGIEVNRLQVDIPHLFVKYDYKTNINGKKVSDVLGIFATKTINTKIFTFEPGVIKLGDIEGEGEYFLDLFTETRFKDFSVQIDVGRGMSKSTKPRDYIISRFAHNVFTVEVGILSKNGYTNLKQFVNDKYYWAAFHPSSLFIALGNEVNRTWGFFGTQGFDNIANFTFANWDRTNDNFWIRSQWGYKNINQKYFCKENYIIGTSYLVVPPFFYKHFSPISTKGEYSFKVDIKRTGANERFEVIMGKQLGTIGQFAFGVISEGVGNELKTGIVAEYFNFVNFDQFTSSVEIHYESKRNQIIGFITLGYNL